MQDTNYLLEDLYAFLMTKHANGSLHHNFPKHQYNNKTTHAISKSYNSVQLTPKHLLQVLSSQKTLANNLRYLHTEEL